MPGRTANIDAARPSGPPQSARASELRRGATGGARLARLRAALLESPYTLCTQKAEFMTEYFRLHERPHWLFRSVAPLHYRTTKRAMERNFGQGVPQTRWQVALNAFLQRRYVRAEARTTEPNGIRFARAFAHVLERMPLRIYDDELIVGNPSSARIGAPIHPDLGGLLMLPELDTLSTRPVNPLRTTPEQIRALKDDIFPYWFARSIISRAPMLAEDPELANVLMQGRQFILTQFAGISHVTPDYPTVLERGFTGILASLEEAAANARTDEQLAYYEAGRIAAQAAIAYGERWRKHCLAEAAGVDDPQRAAELRRLAEVFAQVPARPARTFYEAVQSVFITHVMVHQESFQHGVSFGRVDQYLYPYYRADIEAGRLTRERAIEILGCFLGKAAELLPLFNTMATEYFSGLSSASGLTLGGVNAEGNDATNELSFLVLAAYDQMRLRQPNLHVRLHAKTRPDFLGYAHDILKKGGGMPALFSDEAVVPALETAGFAPEDARDYAIVGCVEWGVPRKSFPAAGACFLSLPTALDLALFDGHGGADGADRRPRHFACMDEVRRAFLGALDRMVAAAAAGNNAIERAHAAYRPTPFLSLLVQGCTERGLDVNAGGAVYNTAGLQGVGLADVADSLAAVEHLVFEQGRVPLDELLGAVTADFRGREDLRQLVLSKVPKYGEDAGRAEAWAAWVAEEFCRMVARHRLPRGGAYAPGFWTMTTHVGFGSRLGALPSGRRAGIPLSDGISPVNGSDRRGPTASMMAAARVAGPHVANGLCLNEKLAPWYVQGEAGTAIMTGLTGGYFRAGGMHVQYNVLDPQVLIDAKLHPERYRDLVVRISGYSAYFNDLTDEMKDDIIARTLHGTGPGCQG